MGLQRYWTGVIDAIALEEAAGLPCKILVPNPEVFLSDYSGNTVNAADGTPQTQLVRIFKAGVAFSFTVEQMPQTLYNTVKAYLAGKIPTLTSVRVNITDGIDTINVLARPDLPQWISRGEPSGAYVQNVTFSFISTGA